MNLPFTSEQFLSVFEQYNTTVWPLQVFLNILALVAVGLAIRPSAISSRIITAILAFLWFWTGIAYHITFFADINPAARVFGAANVLQAFVFVYCGLLKPQLTFRFQPSAHGILGALFLLYALLIYPLLGAMSGHAYPSAPTFGLPCPTTIFTFGLLFWTDGRVPKLVLVIPFLWSLIGFSAALTLGIHEDIGLLVTGVLGTALLYTRRHRRGPEAASV